MSILLKKIAISPPVGKTSPIYIVPRYEIPLIKMRFRAAIGQNVVPQKELDFETYGIGAYKEVLNKTTEYTRLLSSYPDVIARVYFDENDFTKDFDSTVKRDKIKGEEDSIEAGEVEINPIDVKRALEEITVIDHDIALALEGQHITSVEQFVLMDQNALESFPGMTPRKAEEALLEAKKLVGKDEIVAVEKKTTPKKATKKVAVEEEKEVEEIADEAMDKPLGAVNGIGPKLAERLVDLGITTIFQITNMTRDDLIEIEDIGEGNVDKIMASAKELA